MDISGTTGAPANFESLPRPSTEEFRTPVGGSATNRNRRLSFAVRPHAAAAMLNLEHIAVEVGCPLPALHRQLQIAERVANEGLDLAPKEARVSVGEVGRAGIAETRIAADLLEFMREGIEIAWIERVGELAAEVGRPQQAGLGVRLGVVLVLGHREACMLDGAADAIRVDERMVAEAFAHCNLRTLDMPRPEEGVGRAAWRRNRFPLRVDDVAVRAVPPANAAHITDVVHQRRQREV